jgi:hypothetical protein
VIADRLTSSDLNWAFALVAQSCIDANVALITRDADFVAFSDNAELGIVLR